MNWSRAFVELDTTVHNRKSFDCGKEELNLFFYTRAARHMETGISTTMVLPAAEDLSDPLTPVCAFYTITPGAISRETLPNQMSKKLPLYPVPIFLLAQLAVHQHCQGQGLGKITLIKALEKLWQINAYMRAYAVLVDCLDDEAEQFYTMYGFEVLTTHHGRTRMFLPMTVVGQLFQQ